jgi:anti-sigma factor RsiW
MTARIVNLQPDVHKVVDALLPWYVNGTLDEDELASVSQHLRDCASCRAEVHWLRDLHAACISAESIPGAPRAFAGLRRKFELRSPQGATPKSHPRGAFRGTAWSAVATGIALVALVTVTASSLREPLDSAPYHTLGATGAAGNTAGSLIVVFDPSTTEADLRHVLREAHARVVDGPTLANAYVLDVAPALREDALHALRAQRAVVLAEKLSAQDEP